MLLRTYYAIEISQYEAYCESLTHFYIILIIFSTILRHSDSMPPGATKCQPPTAYRANPSYSIAPFGHHLR